MRSGFFLFLVCLLLVLNCASFADTVLFNSGSFNGNSWTITPPFSVGDDFVLQHTSTISSFDLTLLSAAPAVPVSLDWTIRASNGSSPGAVLASGSVSHLNGTNIGTFVNYNIFSETIPV